MPASAAVANGTPLWPLFQAILGSIVQVVLVSIAGYVLAILGYLDKKMQRQLNVINVNFFTPCLLFSKVAFTLSSDKFLKLWIIPLFFLLLSGISFVVAWLLGSIFRLSRPHKNFAMAAAMIMNSNSLPVALLQALAVSVPGLEWGQNDTADAIVGRALTYLLLCGTVGQFIRWSFGVHLLSNAVSPGEIEDFTRLENEIDPRTESDDGTGTPGLGHTWRNANREGPMPIFNSDEGSEREDVPIPTYSPPASFARGMLRAGATTLGSISGFMTPPLWASVMSLVVVLCQPLQNFINGYLLPVRGAIAQAGDCSIPLTLVVLGAYFYRPPNPDEAEPLRVRWQQVTLTNRLRKIFCLDRDGQEGLIRLESYAPYHGSQSEGRTIFVTILARMFVVPMLFLPLVVLGALRGSPSVFKEYAFTIDTIVQDLRVPTLARCS
ncbi:membrane transport protein-domain-containing protein [Russula dissimulans]|nr:membrane transport protein-domain-containing protein [Russula dissimulans]